MEPPNVVSVGFSPTTLDASASDVDIVFTVHLTDDLSGVSGGSSGYSQARFFSPSGGQLADVGFSPLWDLVGGTPLDGTYESTMTVPRYAEPGIWQLAYLALYDEVGNHRTLDRNQMIASGFPVDFTVTSAGDTEPPAVVAFAFAPTVADASASDASVTFTVRLTDNLSGVTDGVIGGIGRSPSQARFSSPSGAQIADVIFCPGDLVSGNILDGVYSSAMIVPRGSESGTWRLEYLWLVDDIGNMRSLDRDQMNASGFPTELEVKGLGDTAPVYFKGFPVMSCKFPSARGPWVSARPATAHSSTTSRCGTAQCFRRSGRGSQLSARPRRPALSP